MLNELRDIDNRRTVVTYVLMLCIIGVTIGCQVFTNLVNVFGEQSPSLPFYKQFVFIFYHGVNNDMVSSVGHMLINLYFLFIIGTLVEKILGSFRFIVMIVITSLIYGLSVNRLGLYGPAATGLVWALAPIAGYLLLEARRIKTRSMYEDHYSFVRVNIIVILTVLPLFTIFLQFFLRGNISNLKAVYHGLLPFILTLAIGIGFTLLWRGHIKKRMKSFNRRKKLQYDGLDNYGWVMSGIIPGYIALVLYLVKYM